MGQNIYDTYDSTMLDWPEVHIWLGVHVSHGAYVDREVMKH
jgi:hypothetical protein